MSLSKNHDPVTWNYFLSVLQQRRKVASILSPLVISQFVHSRLLSSPLTPSLRWDTRREESRRQTFNKMTYLCFGGMCGMAALSVYCLVIASRCFIIFVRQCLWQLIYSKFNSIHGTMWHCVISWWNTSLELNFSRSYTICEARIFHHLKCVMQLICRFLLQPWFVYSSRPLLCHRWRKDYKGYTCASSLKAPPASPRCILGIDYPSRCDTNFQTEDGRDKET